MVTTSASIGYLFGKKTQNNPEVLLKKPKNNKIESTKKSEPHSTSQKLKDKDKQLVKQLLAEDLGKRVFSFADIIESSTEKKILPFSKQEPSHRALLKIIEQTAKESMKELNQAGSPIQGLRRINEASRFFEDKLLKKINAHPNFSCHVPKNSKGKRQRSGYPDLRILHLPSNTTAFLDPKLYEDKSERSTFRSFYYEPKKNNIKIHYDGLHFLLGIKHDGKDGNWTFTGLKILDLSRLNVRLKAEFQTSNKKMYNNNMEIHHLPNN